MFIYKITNLINKKCYIGSTTKDINFRFNEHCRKSNSKKSIVSKAIQKYGRENFEIILLETGTEREELFKREGELIREHNTLTPNGYNQHDNKYIVINGTGHSRMTKKCQLAAQKARTGSKHTDETRKLMSDKLKGKKPSRVRPVEDNHGNKYASIYEACRILNISVITVYNTIWYNRPSRHGLLFKYLGDK